MNLDVASKLNSETDKQIEREKQRVHKQTEGHISHQTESVSHTLVEADAVKVRTDVVFIGELQ